MKEAEIFKLRAENQHMKAQNNQLRGKIRALSSSPDRKGGESEVSEDPEEEILYVTSAVKKQVMD